MENGLLSGMPSLLLDVLPVAAMIFLGVSFLRERYACRKEERALRAAIDRYKEENEEKGEEQE